MPIFKLTSFLIFSILFSIYGHGQSFGGKIVYALKYNLKQTIVNTGELYFNDSISKFVWEKSLAGQNNASMENLDNGVRIFQPTEDELVIV